MLSWIAPGSVPLIDSHKDQDGIARVLGRVTAIHSGAAGAQRGESLRAPLMGTVSFADSLINPAAEVAFQLYRVGMADALSVSFVPQQRYGAGARGCLDPAAQHRADAGEYQASEGGHDRPQQGAAGQGPQQQHGDALKVHRPRVLRRTAIAVETFGKHPKRARKCPPPRECCALM